MSDLGLPPGAYDRWKLASPYDDERDDEDEGPEYDPELEEDD